MKAIKSLLAVSVLAAAGVANAGTVATWADDGSGSSIAFSSTIIYGGSNIVTGYSQDAGGTARLDDIGGGQGQLTIDLPGAYVQSVVGTNNQFSLEEVLTGTLSGGTFTATSGTHNYLTCADFGSAAGCPNIVTNYPIPAVAAGSVSISSGGTVSLSMTDPNSGATSSFIYTLGAGTPVSSVPVPAAAWLFGSGLLGLAGTARRRNAA